jgi:septum formation protein
MRMDALPDLPTEAARPRVILASQSPRRRDLLDQVGIAHEVRPADVDETPHPGEAPGPHAERLAREKAAAIARTAPDALVIGSDTIVVVDHEILGKPRDAADAARMLRRLGGRTHHVITGVAVAQGDRIRSAVERVDVTFGPLDEARIAGYVASGEPMDKAGAYGIQGLGAVLVDRIDGDYFAVMGLPLARLVRLLEAFGWSYRFPAPTRVAG